MSMIKTHRGCFMCSSSPDDVLVDRCANCKARREAALERTRIQREARLAARKAEEDAAHLDEARAIDETLALNRESEWLRGERWRLDLDLRRRRRHA